MVLHFMKTYNSNLDKHHFIHFHRFRCNEPTTLTLITLISLKFDCFKIDSNADHIRAGPEKCITLKPARKVHYFKMAITVSQNFSSHVQKGYNKKSKG